MEAPVSLLKATPAGLAQDVKDVLARPGTYTILANNHLFVPRGNATWKGEQARLIAVWGGDDAGNRLHVVARDPIVLVTPVSLLPVDTHTWAYLVTPLPAAAGGQTTQLEARTAAAAPGKPLGTLHAAPLPVTVLPETGTSAHLQAFAGGGRAATVDAIIAEARRQGVTLDDQIAYMLATAEHESGLAPIRERNYKGEPNPAEQSRRAHLTYYPYYGRGYTQLTHRGHYVTEGTRLGINLAADPDLALQANVALSVIVHGMIHGTFTGARLSRYINARGTDFREARRVINGTDRADHIAGLATAWQAELRRRAARP
jgi:predicted chitinase